MVLSTRADYMELMMMQNAQLNQLVTSQLMLSLMRPQQQQQLPPPVSLRALIGPADYKPVRSD